MLHIKKLIERRFPRAASQIIETLFLVSATVLALGLGVLWLTS